MCLFFFFKLYVGEQSTSSSVKFFFFPGSFLSQSTELNMQSAAVMQICSGVATVGRVLPSVSVCSTVSLLSLCFQQYGVKILDYK